MNKIRFVLASERDAFYIAGHLRQADQDELKASLGDDVDIEKVLCDAVKTSGDLCWTALDESQTPVMLFGASRITDEIGSPWLLGTSDMSKYKKALVRDMKRYIARGHDRYAILMNRIDARNTKTIKWLECLGFQIEEPIPHGPYDMPFHLFHSEVETRV